MSDVQPKRSNSFIVVLLTIGALATFGVILWSASSPSVPPGAGASGDAMQSRNEENRQRESLQEAIKNIQASQQSLAGQIEDIKRQIAREGGERKQLSDQVGSLSARVDGLSTANAGAAGPARKGR